MSTETDSQEVAAIKQTRTNRSFELKGRAYEMIWNYPSVIACINEFFQTFWY